MPLKITRLITILILFLTHEVGAQMSDAPSRNEGLGPYDKLIVRGVTLIDGTGAPPIGPVDIVVEKNRISQISIVGYSKWGRIFLILGLDSHYYY